jgi:hypothetical protein
MKKIIKLTESDLTRIIKRVIEEKKESINESATVNGITIDAKYGNLSTKAGQLVNDYKILVSCSKLGITAYEGPVAIETLWNGKDGGIAGKDNTGKVFSIPLEKAKYLVSKMKNGDVEIKTEGSGTIAGISGTCKVTLKKRK